MVVFFSANQTGFDSSWLCRSWNLFGWNDKLISQSSSVPSFFFIWASINSFQELFTELLCFWLISLPTQRLLLLLCETIQWYNSILRIVANFLPWLFCTHFQDWRSSRKRWNKGGKNTPRLIYWPESASAQSTNGNFCASNLLYALIG